MADVDLACSVVIPTYNAEAYLDEELGALAAQTFRGPFEVVIADNGSTDRSAEVAERWRDRLPHLRVVDASRARGVSAARNDGIRAATTNVILICDADDVVGERWVEAMMASLTTDPFVGGVLDTRSLSTLSAQAWVPIGPLTIELPSLWGTRYPFGCNMGMQRAVFESVGGFDESYPGGAEEIDFAWRVQDRGHALGLAAGAVVNYRLRSDLRGILRQQFNSGRGTAQVFATFRPQRVVVRSWHRRLRHDLLLLRQFPLRGGSVARGTWLSTLAFEAGKIRGALEHRCPVP